MNYKLFKPEDCKILTKEYLLENKNPDDPIYYKMANVDKKKTAADIRLAEKLKGRQ